MDSDKSLTLPDNTLTFDDNSLSNIAGYDRSRHELITSATNRANIQRIALIWLYFLPQAVDRFCNTAVEVFICMPHSLVNLILCQHLIRVLCKEEKQLIFFAGQI